MNSEEIENPCNEFYPSDNNANACESLISFEDKTPQIDSLINMSFQSEQNLK